MGAVEFGASVVLGASLANNFGPVLGSAEKRIGALGKAVDKARLGKRLSGEILRLGASLEELRRRKQALGGTSEFLDRKIARVEKAMGAATRKARFHGLEIGNAAKAHREFGEAIDRSQAKLRKARRQEARRERQQYRRSLVADAMPTLGAAYGAARLFGKAMEVEERQVHLQTVINTDDGDTEAAAQRAREHAAEFARNSLATETEVLEIQYNLHSAGLGEAAATAGAEVAHKVAVATKGNSDQVAAVIGTTFNNLGDSIAGADPAEKIGRIGDVLTQVQQKYQINDFGQLGEGMAEAAAGATRAKLPFEQAAVAIGMMNNAGTTGSSAGTALNAVLRQLPDAAEKLGFSAVRGSDGSLDLAASLAELRERLPPEDEVDARARAIQNLFGDEGAKGLGPLLENLDQYREGIDAAGASEGTFESAYGEISETSSAKWQMAKQNIEQVGTALADALLPTVGFASDILRRAAGFVASLAQRFPWLAAAVGSVAIAFVGFVAGRLVFSYLRSLSKDVGEAIRAFRRFAKQLTLTNIKTKALAVGGALRRFGTSVMDTARTGRQALVRFGRQLTLTNLRMRALAVGGAVKKFGSALVGLASGGIKAAIAGLRALGAAIAANPIGLIITAVVLAAALIWKYWEPIKAFFARLFAPLVEFARPIFAWIGGKVSAVAGWILARLRPVGAFFRRLFAPLVEFARPIFAWISAKVSAVAGWILARLRPVAAFYGRVFGAVLEFLRPVFAWIGAKIAAIVGWARKALGVVGPAFAVLLGPIGLLIGAAVLLWKFWEPIKGFFAGLWNGIAAGASAAFGFLGRVWEGVKSAFSGLRSVVQGAVGAVFSWLENFSLADIGKNLLSTLGDGILAAKDAVVEKVGAVFGAVRNLLPFSDAREGPFARLTTSGAAILGTVGEGVRRAGPGPLRRPLQSALGAAVVGLGVPTAAPGVPGLHAGSPPAPPARSAPAQIVISPGALVVNFQGAPDDPARIVAEVERQLADLFRRAANEARLLETDDA